MSPGAKTLKKWFMSAIAVIVALFITGIYMCQFYNQNQTTAKYQPPAPRQHDLETSLQPASYHPKH
jgi:hypothetical protein